MLCEACWQSVLHGDRKSSFKIYTGPLGKCLILKENGEGSMRHLFVVGADEVEHKAPVHERQQLIQEEGQTAV